MLPEDRNPAYLWDMLEAAKEADEMLADYDLSALSSHKYGLGIKYSPLYGLGRMKVPFRKKNVMLLKSMEVRGAYYERSTGLNAFIVSMGLSFTIK